jgi:hypothetical protein
MTAADSSTHDPTSKGWPANVGLFTQMSGSHETRSSARPFVISAYRADVEGVLRPDMPDVGWCATENSECCRLSVDHRRPRTTGPRYPLTVLRCATHKRAFTVYPPGYAPYARTPMTVLAPDGGHLQGRSKSGAERFRGTLFDAALDAANGIAWSRESSDSPQHRWWGTQLRHLALAMRLLGIAVNAKKTQEQIAQTLAIDLLTLHEQEAKLRIRDGYRQQGEAVRRVLAGIITALQFLPERLFECGYIVAHWGPCHRWLPEPHALRRQPFRAVPGIQRVVRPP